MHGRKEPVVDWESEVVVVQFDQGGLKLLGFAEADSKGVGLELKPSAQTGHAEIKETVVGSGDELENDHQSDKDRFLRREPERRVQDLTLTEVSEEGKHGEDVHLADDDVLEDVIKFPMSQFVGQNGQNLGRVATFVLVVCLLFFVFFFFLLGFLFLFLFVFFGFEFFSLFQLEQGVEEDNPFEIEEPVEVGVRVGRPGEERVDVSLAGKIRSEWALASWILRPQRVCKVEIRYWMPALQFVA